MLHTVLAALGLATCIALAVHMALPYRARNRVDAAVARLGAWLQAQFDNALGWRRRQRQTRAAALEAQRVIRTRAGVVTAWRRAAGRRMGRQRLPGPRASRSTKKPH